jgi:hypothetical protein
MVMDREEWLRRFRARLLERNPSMAADVLAGIAGTEAYETLGGKYPDNPEDAVEDDTSGTVSHRRI